MDLINHLLAFNIAGYALGGVVVCAAVVRRLWVQVVLTVLLVSSSYLLFETDAAVSDLVPVVGNLPPFLLIGLVTLAVARLFFVAFPKLHAFTTGLIMPQLWKPQPAAPLSSSDAFKRWFVTVSAATGALVAMLMRGSEFWSLVSAAFHLEHLLFTLLLVVVSFTLIGPVEDYVFEISLASAGESDAADLMQPSRLEQLFQRLSWRAYGRLAIVFVLVLLYPVLLGCVEDRFHNVKDQETAQLLVASLVPSVVTYYWSAALQRGVASIARTAAAAATALLSVLSIPAALVTTTVIVVASTQRLTSGPSDGVLAFEIALWMFLFWISLYIVPTAAASAAGVPAAIGGAILGAQRRAGRDQPILTIGVITALLAGLLALTSFSNIALMDLLPGAKLSAADRANLMSLPVGTVGWGVGLIVSGFPDIFKRAMAKTD